MPGRLLILAGITLASLTCRPSANPELHVSPRSIGPVVLDGIVVDSAKGHALTDAHLRLEQLATGAARTARVDGGGRFQFANLPLGRYLLVTRHIGYLARHDSITLSSPAGLSLRLTMSPQILCLDVCPPDPAVVAAALAQRHRWQCDRDAASLEVARTGWAGALSRLDLGGAVGVRADSATVYRQLRRVGNDRLCGELADSVGGVTALAFTVFRLGEYWLFSQPGFDGAIVLDSSLVPVLGNNGMFWWSRPAAAPPNPGFAADGRLGSDVQSRGRGP